jgi:hypothetical protein
VKSIGVVVVARIDCTSPAGPGPGPGAV